ncbi:MAG: RICIN domain-containing protein [Oscillospiraceae bacterium]|nr:RICIN domain-containing protein [Oscillospiraceae bacterium]
MKQNRVFSALLTGCVMLGSLPLLTASAGNYTRVAVHDPSVVKTQDGSYFIIGSHLGAARSADLMNWTSAANSDRGSTGTTFFNNIYTDLAVPEKWSNTTDGYDLSGNMWAPDIIYNTAMGKYCMYLSVNGQVWNSSVVLCTADSIEGPYTYQGTIVYSGFTNNSVNNVNDTDVPKVLGHNPDISRYLTNGGWNAAYGTNAIDPAVFYDETGSLHMVYGSWFGGIYMLELDEQTGLRDYNVKYETKANVADAYMGQKIAGGNYVSGEGPYIEYMKAPGAEKGYYYLFLSYGYFNSNGGYNMRIFRSENPQGPYTDQNGNSAIYPSGADNIGGTTGERLMSNYQWACNDRPFKAQGHNSALMDDDGKLYVIYHTKFDDAYGFHEVRVHQLIMNDDGWITAAPYEYSGESLSDAGHTAAAVTGEYDFIFHTLNQKFENEKSADVEKPQSISLNADGTVSGAVTGTWAMRSGTPYMSITFNNVTYKGAFLVQADESAAMTQRMTFTATGNNTCVWGSKKAAYDRAADVVDLTPLENGTYTLQSVNSGLYLNTNAAQSAEQNTDAAVWTLKQTGDGYYTVQNAAGKALTVENGSADNGADILLADLNGGTAQKFRIVQEGEGVYALLTAASGSKGCADVYNISTEPGANICQWEYWGGDGQKYRIVPAKAAAGDVNADGQTDRADALALQRYLLTLETALPDPQAADVNGDGRLTGEDLTMLKRSLLQ